MDDLKPEMGGCACKSTAHASLCDSLSFSFNFRRLTTDKPWRTLAHPNS